jgi:hypothetical protein
MSRRDILQNKLTNNLKLALKELTSHYDPITLATMDYKVTEMWNQLDYRDLRVFEGYTIEDMTNLLECYEDL